MILVQDFPPMRSQVEKFTVLTVRIVKCRGAT